MFHQEFMFRISFRIVGVWGSLGYLLRVSCVGKILNVGIFFLCWRMREDVFIHVFFLTKGLPGCLQFYHDTCSKPGEKLNQEIIDRLQTENTHLKS